MIKKLTLVAGLGAGYVLGAKAGTQRYDQIMGQVNALLGRPEVQRATGAVTEKATAVASDLADTAKEKAGAVTDSVKTATSSEAVDPTPSLGTPGTARAAGAAPSDTV